MLLKKINADEKMDEKIKDETIKSLSLILIRADINDGESKADALNKHGISEEFYDKNIEHALLEFLNDYLAEKAILVKKEIDNGAMKADALNRHGLIEEYYDANIEKVIEYYKYKDVAVSGTLRDIMEKLPSPPDMLD